MLQPERFFPDNLAWASTQHDATIKLFCLDHGGEYTGNKLGNYLDEQGTEHRLTTYDMPQHNSIAESINRQLLKHVRAMLHQLQLPKYLWGEAILHAVWLKNWTSTHVLGNTTPYEWLHGKKPNLSEIPEWKQCVWVYNDLSSKLDVRTTEAHWVSYDADSTHIYRIYWQDKNSISVKRNVKFTSPMIMILVLMPQATTTMPTLAATSPAALPAPAPATPAPATTTTAPMLPPSVTFSREEEIEDDEDSGTSKPTTYATPMSASKGKTVTCDPPSASKKTMAPTHRLT